MRHSAFLFMLLPFLVYSEFSNARDTKHLFPIVDAMNTSAAAEKLNPAIKFYFGDKQYPIERDYGEDFTNKKTNAFNKSDKVACEWAFLSAVLQLQDRAQQLGADAVVNIHSFYKKVPFISETQYECHAGGVIAGVALKGRFVNLGGGHTSSQNTVPYDSEVREMQRLLTDLGYEPGPADGLMGKKTIEAVERFQSDKDLLVTGKLDDKTIAAIKKSQPGSTQNSVVEKRTVEESDENSDQSGNKNTTNNCTVEMVLNMKEIGLTTEQIEAACNN